MKTRHLNGWMLLAALIGGVIGFILGELIVKRLQYRIPGVLLVGIYFSVFAVCVLVMCFLAECFYPRLTSYMWRDKYKGKMFAITVPAVLAGFFILGCLFQFIYSLGTVKNTAVEEPDDFVFLVDQSGSMYGRRAEKTAVAMNNLLDTMPDGKKVGFIAFSDELGETQPLQLLTDTVRSSYKNAATAAMNSCGGGTDIQKALDAALEQYQSASPDRKGSVVLVSDGYDYLDFQKISDDFINRNISIFVVGVQMGFGGVRDYEELADQTGGRYYDAQSVEQLDYIFQSISTNIKKTTRLLIDHRYGPERRSAVYGVMRVIMFCLFGVALGAALGLLFDNKYLLINFMLGGVLTGTLAGLTIEFGCRHYWNIATTRFISDVFLSLVISLFSAVASYEIVQKTQGSTDQSALFGGMSSTAGRSVGNYSGRIG